MNAPVDIGVQQRTYRRFKIAFVTWIVTLALAIAAMLAEQQAGVKIPSVVFVPLFLAMIASPIVFYLALSRLAGYMGKSRIIIPGLAFLFASLGGPIWAFIYIVTQAKERGWKNV